LPEPADTVSTKIKSASAAASPVQPFRSIVLTGGPGAGKSVIAREIVARYPDHLVLVPEAATQVYGRLKTRWDRLDQQGRCDVQTQIYRFQRQQEDEAHLANRDKILLLDRGTVDGSAYWPQGHAAYWAHLNTSLEAELSRYESVLWLETAAAMGIYDGEASNACRFEDPPAAIESGRLLLELWGKHPQLRKFPAYPELTGKLDAIIAYLQQILPELKPE
jgi:predicted ATPase